MKCQLLAIFYSPLDSAWIQTPLHASLSVTIVFTTFPMLFGHFLESLIVILFLFLFFFLLYYFIFFTAGYRPGKTKTELTFNAKTKYYQK